MSTEDCSIPHAHKLNEDCNRPRLEVTGSARQNFRITQNPNYDHGRPGNGRRVGRKQCRAGGGRCDFFDFF